MKSLFLALAISGLAFAGQNDLTHRPKSFTVNGSKAVFADFKTADYEINYNIGARSASATATIALNMVESGRLIFDSVETPTSIKLDGKVVTATETKTPQGETTLRVLDVEANRGAHTLIVEVPLKALVEFTGSGVRSAFWTSDLSERQFLERYLPANFEFDQVDMSFTINFQGSSVNQVIYTNGNVRSLRNNSYRISYPSYYTSSSIFFHTVPEGDMEELKFSFKSIDGRNLPGVVYLKRSMMGSKRTLEELKSKTIEIMQELESDYGAFLHSQIIVYNAGLGGMEYCGATMTSKSALGHELFHSYFARGVMPANGNSGWLDEALASWRDEGYQKSGSMMGTSRMSNHPYYTRTTDRAAYSFGERFMRYLDSKTSEKGGLKPFMRYMVDKRSKAPLFVEEFIQEMNRFYGMSFDSEFKQYTYGSYNSFSKSLEAEHPIHRKMTVEELKKFL
jgi:hypothetical protein